MLLDSGIDGIHGLVAQLGEVDEKYRLALEVAAGARLGQVVVENDLIAAKYSLGANLSHWKNGKQINCRDWIKELLLDVTPLAKELDMFELLLPIETVLRYGNQSMIWLNSYSISSTS